MKVKELIEQLQSMPQDAEVVIPDGGRHKAFSRYTSLIKVNSELDSIAEDILQNYNKEAQSEYFSAVYIN
jgi:hypothetical protein